VSGWVIAWHDTRVGVAILDAIPASYADGPHCDASFREPDADLTWHCGRTLNHPGRHMAALVHLDASTGPAAFGDGWSVKAAWPGDHEPTAADLEAVPS
jgi:hypothetical protein